MASENLTDQRRNVEIVPYLEWAVEVDEPYKIDSEFTTQGSVVNNILVNILFPYIKVFFFDWIASPALAR